MPHNNDRMPDWAFKTMAFMFRVANFFAPADKKLIAFNIQKGFTVVDYGCGPGRYIRKAAELVGASGRVYAVDIHELAIQEVSRIKEQHQLDNVVPVLAQGYSVGIDQHTADLVYALDMFHGVHDPENFLKELYRIIKKDGRLILEDGHQPRAATREKVGKSDLWIIEAEYDGYLKCRPQ